MKWTLLFLLLYCHCAVFSQIISSYPFREIIYDGEKAMHLAFAPDATMLYFDAMVRGQRYVFAAEVSDSVAVRLHMAPALMAAPLKNGGLLALEDMSSNAKMLTISGKKSMDLLNKRKVEMRFPALNSGNNLIVFSGKQKNDKYFSLMSYDFRYDNLNVLLVANRDINYPRWSAKANFISYDTYSADERPIIGIMRWDRSPYAHLISDTLQLYQASWGATERRLLCVGKNENGYQLLLINLSGEMYKVLATSNKPLFFPVWSFDGRYVAVVLQEEKQLHRLLLFDLENEMY